MSIEEAILAALDAAYELTGDELYDAVRLRCDENECPIRAKHVVDAIEALVKERWLIHEMKQSVSHYRRRTPAQHAAIIAAENPNQTALF